MSHQLETIIGYKFKNPKLLETALTHTSYANESRTPVQHNERLEFLGDSVLQIVSADYLFHAYADRPEGDLTRIRYSLVSEGALFQFEQEINLGEYLRLGRGDVYKRQGLENAEFVHDTVPHELGIFQARDHAEHPL